MQVGQEAGNAWEVEKTKERFEGKSENNTDVRCAMDDIIRREILLSEKENRAPMLHSRTMHGEVGQAGNAYIFTCSSIVYLHRSLALR